MNQNPFSNLRQQYVGGVLQNVAEGASRAFKDIFAQKPAEVPLPRNNPEPEEPDGYGEEYEDDYKAASQQHPHPGPPQNFPPHYQNPPRHLPPPPRPPYQNPQFGTPYMPTPTPPRYKVDEEFLRKMAKLQAATNMKYIETYGRFARNVVSNMAASNAMVEMVKRADEKDKSLTPDDLIMVETVRRAVTKRKAIETAKAKVLTDEELREIYEELIFQDMYDKNERGDLTLQTPHSFAISLLLLTTAEVVESGKDVIGDRISGGYKKLTGKFSRKK